MSNEPNEPIMEGALVRNCETCKHIDPCIRMDSVGSGQCMYLCRMQKRTVKHSESCPKWEPTIINKQGENP